MLDSSVAMSTTRDAVSRLAEAYKHFLARSGIQGESSIEGSHDDVYHQLMEQMRELDWLLRQTEGLRQKLLGTSQLV